MKKADVEIGGIYAVKVSERVVPVRILYAVKMAGTGLSAGGWMGLNTKTGREIRIKTAGRLRGPWKSKS